MKTFDILETQNLCCSKRVTINGLSEDSILRSRAVLMFQGLSDVFLRSILVRMKFDAYPPSETVVIEGELGTEMFFISKGKMRVIVNGTQIGTREEGEFFGEVSMYHNKGRRTATVLAMTYCEVNVVVQGQ